MFIALTRCKTPTLAINITVNTARSADFETQYLNGKRLQELRGTRATRARSRRNGCRSRYRISARKKVATRLVILRVNPLSSFWTNCAVRDRSASARAIFRISRQSVYAIKDTIFNNMISIAHNFSVNPLRGERDPSLPLNEESSSERSDLPDLENVSPTRIR